MSKISISVCLGTTCHLMGSSHLQNLPQELPSALLEAVEINWKRCLGLCHSNQGKAPFVIINEEVVSEATMPRIVEKVEYMLQTNR